MVLTDIPVIRTRQLVLRAPRLSDFEDYAAFCASDRTSGLGGPFSRAQAFERMSALIGHWPLRGYGRWMMADPASDVPLGVAGLMYPEGWPEPEIAWSVFAPAEGRGLAREAAEAALRYAYRVLGWTRVVSCSMPGNARSIALAQRMGAVHESDFQHPTLGPLMVWRHRGPEAVQ